MAIDRKTVPPAHLIERLEFPPLRTLTLDNGIEVTLLDYGTQPVTCLSLLYHGGTSDVRHPEAFSLMEKLLSEGTKQYTGAQLSELLDFHGAWLMPIDTGHYMGYSLYSLNAQLENVLEPALQIFTQATLPQREFDALKGRNAQQLSELLLRPAYLAQKQLARRICGPSHPIARKQTPEQIQAATRSQAQWLYWRQRASAPMAFIGGRLDSATEARCLRALEAMPVSADAPGIKIKHEPFHSLKPKTVHIHCPGSLQTSIAMGLNVPLLRSDPQYVPLRIAIMALGGYFGSRLMGELRERRGYTYGIQSSLMGAKDGTLASIQMDCDHRYAGDAIRAIKGEIVRMVTDPLSADEMQRLRAYLTSAVAQQFESPFTLLESAMQQQTIGCPIDYYPYTLQTLATITPDDISRLIAQYMPIDQLQVVVCS